MNNCAEGMIVKTTKQYAELIGRGKGKSGVVVHVDLRQRIAVFEDDEGGKEIMSFDWLVPAYQAPRGGACFDK